MQAMIVYPVSTTDPDHTLLFPALSEARAYVAALAAHLESLDNSGLESWEVIREEGYAEASFEEDYRHAHPGVFALLSEQHDQE